MMKQIVLLLSALLLWPGTAMAVPETVSVRVTDVTTSSFSVVWMTNVAAEPTVEVYADASMSRSVAGAVIVPMPDLPGPVAAVARSKGIMQVRIAGLAPGTTCWVRTVTRDPADPGKVGYSSLRQVTTAERVVPYRRDAAGHLQPVGNDLLSFRVYVRPADTAQLPALGDLLLLEAAETAHPLSAFVGAGAVAPEGLLDLGNLFDIDGRSLAVDGGERALLRVYRGGTLSSLLHYRRLPTGSGLGGVGEPVRGFFADVNLDGRVDMADFEAFRSHYRTGADDGGFNPDFNFVAVEDGRVIAEDRVDARDFARFATQYGRTDVEENPYPLSGF